ncbi:MAG: hypothetical protein Q7J85_12570 [Bacillota bacterium]|nr:hypothetical protein [Bacillota bacterium]
MGSKGCPRWPAKGGRGPNSGAAWGLSQEVDAYKGMAELMVPTMGNTVFLSVPRVLGKAALDAGRRVADSMKVRKSELAVETMLARLKREADDRLRRLRQLL